MKMKIVTCMALCAFALGAFCEQAGQKGKPRMTNRDYIGMRLGGWIKRMPENPGKVVFVNAQKSVGSGAMAETVSTMIHYLKINLEIQESDETVSLASADKTLKATGGNAAIFIVDSPDYPISLVAVESKWAFLNVAPLKVGAKDASAVADRTNKELWRVFVMLLGGSDTEMPHCLMRPAFSGNEIGALKDRASCPEPFEKMRTHMEALGVKTWYETTYRDACRQGWAPLPTNDTQKAIWDKVHALPTNPIEIKYDPKRDK